MLAPRTSPAMSTNSRLVGMILADLHRSPPARPAACPAPATRRHSARSCRTDGCAACAATGKTVNAYDQDGDQLPTFGRPTMPRLKPIYRRPFPRSCRRRPVLNDLTSWRRQSHGCRRLRHDDVRHASAPPSSPSGASGATLVMNSSGLPTSPAAPRGILTTASNTRTEPVAIVLAEIAEQSPQHALILPGMADPQPHPPIFRGAEHTVHAAQPIMPGRAAATPSPRTLLGTRSSSSPWNAMIASSSSLAEDAAAACTDSPEAFM